MTYGGVAGARVWAYYDLETATKDAVSRKATILNNTQIITPANEKTDQTSVNRSIKEYISSCNTFAQEMSIDTSSCANKENITTKYTTCKNKISNYQKIISSYTSSVSGYVNSGYIKNSDSLYTDFNNACSTARENLKEYSNYLDYLSNKDYNEDMGTDIKTSLTDDEIKNNKYIKKYKTSSDEYNTEDIAFLQICNPNHNKETLVAFRLVGIIITIVKIIVPIIIIVLGMIDMSKAVFGGKDESIIKSLKTLLFRIFAGILIFFAPTIVRMIFETIDGWDNVESKFHTCMLCVTGSNECPDVSFEEAFRTGE